MLRESIWFFVLILGGCASSISEIKSNHRLLFDAEAACQKSEFRKLQKFTFAMSTQPPKGMNLDEVPEYMKTLRESFDTLTSRWVTSLADVSLLEFQSEGLGEYKSYKRSNSEEKKWPNELRSITSSYGDDYIETEHSRVRLADYYKFVHIAPVSPGYRTFVYCKEDQCEGLLEPFGKTKIENQAASSEHPVFSSKAATDTFQQSTTVVSLYQDGTAYSEDLIGRVIANTGYHLGYFVKEHYFVAPDRELASLCTKVTGKKPCLVEKQATRETRSTQALVLALLAGSSSSDQVKEGWLIREITFNPEILCRLARPRSELLVE